MLSNFFFVFRQRIQPLCSEEPCSTRRCEAPPAPSSSAFRVASRIDAVSDCSPWLDRPGWFALAGSPSLAAVLATCEAALAACGHLRRRAQATAPSARVGMSSPVLISRSCPACAHPHPCPCLLMRHLFVCKLLVPLATPRRQRTRSVRARQTRASARRRPPRCARRSRPSPRRSSTEAQSTDRCSRRRRVLPWQASSAAAACSGARSGCRVSPLPGRPRFVHPPSTRRPKR